MMSKEVKDLKIDASLTLKHAKEELKEDHGDIYRGAMRMYNNNKRRGTYLHKRMNRKFRNGCSERTKKIWIAFQATYLENDLEWYINRTAQSQRK